MADEKDSPREVNGSLHTLFKKLKVNNNCKVPKRLTSERCTSRKSVPSLHGCPRVRPYSASRPEPDDSLPSIDSLTLVGSNEEIKPSCSGTGIASRAPRPLIQAARLHLPQSSDERAVLRPAKLLTKAKRASVSSAVVPKHTPSQPGVLVFADRVRRPPADFHTLASRCVGPPQPSTVDSYHGPPFSSYDTNVCAIPSTSVVTATSTPSSCSVEARYDDWSVEELSCYFEDCVNIPKKMSAMAEMMYT